jgi:hypothetical protein
VKPRATAGGGGDGKIDVVQRLSKGGLRIVDSEAHLAPAARWVAHGSGDILDGITTYSTRLLLQQRQQLLRRGVIVKPRATAGGGGDGKIDVVADRGQ